MSVTIKNADVERVLEEIVRLTGESKTEAIRKALEERLRRLALRGTASHNEARLLAFLEEEIWPQIPAEVLGTTFTKAEEEALLGYGNECGESAGGRGRGRRHRTRP